jgi:hypothetical protein
MNLNAIQEEMEDGMQDIYDRDGNLKNPGKSLKKGLDPDNDQLQLSGIDLDMDEENEDENDNGPESHSSSEKKGKIKGLKNARKNDNTNDG